MSRPRRSQTNEPSRKSWHVCLTVPGLLAEVLPQRWTEFHYRSFSPFAIELVCFDLRRRREHELTILFARDTDAGQETIDRDIISRYRPGAPRNREFLLEMITRARALEVGKLKSSHARAQLMAKPKDIYFPACLRPLIEERWVELGYESLSAYVTGLIRYDLILSGPHHYFSGHDKDPELLAALDLATTRAFYAGKRQRILLDYLIEEAAGRKLSDDERRVEMRRLAEAIRANALQGRSAGVSSLRP